jgi:hypothetical protein
MISSGVRPPSPGRSCSTQEDIQMASFPKTEADVTQLAEQVIQGLVEHADVFPTPPVSATELTVALEEFTAACAATDTALVAATERRAFKKELLRLLIQDLKRDIRYAENTVSDDDAKLKLIGWGARAARTARSIELPGRVRNLEHVCLEDGSISLRWKKPSSGGRVLAYKLQSYERDTDQWRHIATAVRPETTLSDQEPGVEEWYRVIALNEAGDGPPSNIISVGL